MKNSVYVETSVVSYLTSRPSRDLISAARQEMTYEWWQTREDYELFVSELVIEEAQQGDVRAAARRLEIACELSRLRIDQNALALAEKLLDSGAVPRVAPRDALHIAVATVHEMDLLLTWNFRHIANPRKLAEIVDVIKNAGLRVPALVTPENLLEELDNER